VSAAVIVVIILWFIFGYVFGLLHASASQGPCGGVTPCRRPGTVIASPAAPHHSGILPGKGIIIPREPPPVIRKVRDEGAHVRPRCIPRDRRSAVLLGFTDDDTVAEWVRWRRVR